MAVVQISKIQVRRGQKNSQSGVPQLSSAEFAWAVDTQELFIGNGSVSEGAPYVGNTKILTEHDNLFELISGYRFGNDKALVYSVERSIQGKLDEYVSVTDFGAVGDGTTDNTAAFENAFLELFRNTDVTLKKTLLIPNGEYSFSSDLRVPSGTVLHGETQKGAKLKLNGNNIRFVTSPGGLELANFNSSNRPVNVNFSNLTITRTTGQVVLSGVADSIFENVIFSGSYNLGDAYASVPVVRIQSILSNVCTTQTVHGLEIGDRFIPRASSNGLVAGVTYYIKTIPASNQFTLATALDRPDEVLVNGGNSPSTGDLLLNIIGDVVSDLVSSLISEPAALFWSNTLIGTRTTNIKFKGCAFEYNSVSIKCTQSDVFDTEIIFDDCKFFINDTGIYISGLEGQTNKWKVHNCIFEKMAVQAWRSTNGRGTLIESTVFKDCGNGTNTSANPTDPIIYFGEKIGNVVQYCNFDRQQNAGVVTSESIAAVTEVYNADKVIISDRNYSTIALTDSFIPLAVFSSFNKFIKINYFLQLGAHSRVGELTMSIGDYNDQMSITDSYQYSPSFISTPEGVLMTNFEFSSELRDNDTDSGIDTVVLKYKNPLLSGATGFISFDVAYGV